MFSIRSMPGAAIAAAALFAAITTPAIATPPLAAISAPDSLPMTAGDALMARSDRKLHAQLGNAADALKAGKTDWTSGLPAALVAGDRVLVEIRWAAGKSAAARSLLAANAIETRRALGDAAIEAWVPAARLQSLAADASIARIAPARLVRLLAGSVQSEGVASGHADYWHSAGSDGFGTRIALIDSYNDTAGQIAALQASGNWPTSVTLQDFKTSACSGFGCAGADHGLATLEIAYDVAPAATYLAYDTNTVGDWYNAILDAANVDATGAVLGAPKADVISASLGAPLDGIGDGTALSGSIAEAAGFAKANGVLVVNAAGNGREEHWSGNFKKSATSNNIHSWSGNTTQINYYGPDSTHLYCIADGYPLQVEVYWNDWTQVDQDFAIQLYRYSTTSGLQLVASSDYLQNGDPNTQSPQEFISYTANSAGKSLTGCPAGSVAYGILLRKTAAANGQGKFFQIFAGAPLQYRVDSNSLNFPADSANVITVAALNVYDSTSEYYSSEGPVLASGGYPPVFTIPQPAGTPFKPDVASFARVSTVSYGTGGGDTAAHFGFAGTSAATPHVAGMAALLKQRYGSGFANVDVLAAALRSIAATGSNDLTPAGQDFLTGYGRLRFQKEGSLVFSQQPGNIVAGSAFSPAIAVGVRDTDGNPMGTYGILTQVALALGNVTTPGAQLLGSSAAGIVAGTASFAGSSVDLAGNGYTLQASAGSQPITATSQAFNVSAAASPSQLRFCPNPANGSAGASLAAFSVCETDSFGNVVTTAADAITLAVASGPTAPSAGTLTVTAINGVATFTDITFGTAGTYTLSASTGAAGVTGATSTSFVIAAASADHLAFCPAPSGTTAGTTLASFAVCVKDAFGNTLTSATDAVTLAIASGPQGATLGGTANVAAMNGVATFADIVLATAGTYTLSASTATPGVTGTTSPSFVISATATADHLEFCPAPGNGTAGAVLAGFAVCVRDQSGNPYTDASGTVTLAVASGPQAAPSAGTLTVTLVNGVASFTDVAFDTTGSYTLSASTSIAGLGSVTSPAFDVAAAAADHLDFCPAPGNGTAGISLGGFAACVKDAFGNLVTSSTDTVSLAVASGPQAAPSAGTTSVAATAGMASFSGIVFDMAGTYTLTASVSASGVASATSEAFVVAPAAANQLAFCTEPADASAGATLAAFSVCVRDAFGNLVTTASDTITIAVANGPAGEPFAGTLSVATVNGVATFGDLVFHAAGDYTLSAASAGGAAGATSASFAIAAGAAHHLFIVSQPTGDIVAGTPFSVAVRIEDQFGNVVLTDNTSSISLAMGANPGNDPSFAGASQAVASGATSFNDVQLVRAANGYTLVVTAPGLIGAASDPFNIVAAAPSQLTFIQSPPQTVLRGERVGTLQVAVQDTYGNLASTASTPITLNIAACGGSMTVGPIAATNGVASFTTGPRFYTVASGLSFTATGGSYAGVASASFDVVANPDISFTDGFDGCRL